MFNPKIFLITNICRLKLSADMKKQFDRIEEDYDYDDLLSWRKLANAYFTAEKMRAQKIEAKKAERAKGRSFWENLVAADTNVCLPLCCGLGCSLCFFAQFCDF
jgi:predicted transcriptional regulator